MSDGRDPRIPGTRPGRGAVTTSGRKTPIVLAMTALLAWPLLSWSACDQKPPARSFSTSGVIARAEALRGRGQFREAVAALEQAVKGAGTRQDRDELRVVLSDTHLSWANKLRRVSDNAAAIEHYKAAYEIDKELRQKVAAGDLNSIGEVYGDLSETRKALEYDEQALAIQRALGDRAGEAVTLNDIGFVYDGLGERRKALEFYEQALPIHRAAGNRWGEAVTLHNIGAAYITLGERRKALEFYEQALPIRRAVGDRVGEAVTLSNIGHAYSDLGEKRKALEYYEQALRINRAIGNRPGEALTLSNIGAAYSDLGERRKALEFYEQALPIRRAVGDRAGEASTLNNFGTVYGELGEKKKALEYYERALKIRQEVGDRAGEGLTLRNIGWVHTLLGEKGKALQYYEQALLMSRAVGERENEAGIAGDLMQAWNSLSKPRLAVFYGKEAVNLYQRLRADIQGLPEEIQHTYLKTVEGNYRSLVDILIAQGRLPEAQQVLGLLKQEEYFDFVRRDAAAAERLTGRADLTPEERTALERYEQAAGRVTADGRRVEELKALKNRTPEQEAELARAKEVVGTASKTFQVVLRQIEDDLGRTSAAKNFVKDLAATRGLGLDLRSPGDSVVVLSTVITEKAVWIIVTTPTAQVAAKTEIAAADLNRKVLAFREALQDPRTDPRPLARELYGILVKPVENDLRGAAPQILAWSLDGILRYLPVAALHDGERYLAERYATALLTLASRSRLTLKPSGKWRALGLGVSLPHKGFPGLPAVREELSAVIREEVSQLPTGGALPGHVLLDGQFTRKSMEASLEKGYPVVHIASHFAFRPGNATDSYLLIGDGSHFTVQDIRTAALPLFDGVELLTLSACDTAMGGERADGREVEGFGVEAQALGAQAVVATLWPVADRSTALIMADFYRRRQELGLSKAEALRQAQLALLRGQGKPAGKEAAARNMEIPAPKKGSAKTGSSSSSFRVDPRAPYAHPYFWAPFILIGNFK